MKKIPKSEWEWYGFPAHLCVSSWCVFHLATKIGDYMVSTVGAYYPPHKSEMDRPKEPTEIGFGRTYETMVFKLTGAFCDCGCGQPEIDASELLCRCYNNAGSANSGHMEICDQVASGAKVLR